MGLNLIDIAIWWLALELIGFLAFPISSYFCRNLFDNGYSVSKPLGLLLITYFSWIISVFTGYSLYSIVISLFILGLISILLYMKKRPIPIDKRYMLEFEVLFFIAFFLLAIIRAFSPDIYWTGGEKFMDMTFINSLLRTTEFPPFDPWMSGSGMYYYYFGYLIVSNLIRITGILPSVAFNLATASFFALSFSTAFGIGFNLTEKIKYGILTGFFVVIAGNLVGFIQLLDIIRKENLLNGILSFNYWTSSRVIPDTINEFPYFSFLHGDVHAHMISITFQLVVILMLLNIIRSDSIDWRSLLITGLSIGFLYPLNTWDYPVYLVLAILIIVSLQFLFINSKRKKDLSEFFFKIGTMAALSYLLYLPYHLSYRIDKTILMVSSGRTSLIFYIAVSGLFLFFIISFILRISKNPDNINNTKNNNKINTNNYFSKFSYALLLIAAVITIIEGKLFILDGIQNPKTSEFELLILLLPVILLSISVISKEKNKNNVFILILIIVGALISLFCEFFYVQDALGSGNLSLIRMNTVFKFYLQNWVIWGICAGYIVFVFRDTFTSKKIWGICAVILILMAAVYPVFATIGKSGGFKGVPELDGASYVKKEHPQDYQAILWFRNLNGQPVVLQAPGELYEWNTAITTFSGLPTVIGWAGHELNWRFPIRNEIDTRWSDASRIYSSRDIREVEELLKKYNVSYIYFGEAEGKRFGNPVLFRDHPDVFIQVFEYGDVVVFKPKNPDVQIER